MLDGWLRRVFGVDGLVGGMIAYDFVYYVTCCFAGVSGG